MSATRTKPFIKRQGGKGKLVGRLLPMLPPSRCYVEAFGGGAALLLAKPKQPKQLEVYNDADGELSNAFRQVRDHGPEVIRCLANRLDSRRDFVASRKADLSGLTEIQRAVRFIFLNRLSFGADQNFFAVRKTPGKGGGLPFELIQHLIESVAKRLDRVVIENLSWERLFKNYDHAETFWFLDPPYLNTTHGSYSRWKLPDWEAFAAGVKLLKGEWILTTGDLPAMRALFSDYPFETWDRVNALEKSNLARYHELIFRSNPV
jgi:DNA adenine methylase